MVLISFRLARDAAAYSGRKSEEFDGSHVGVRSDSDAMLAASAGRLDFAAADDLR